MSLVVLFTRELDTQTRLVPLACFHRQIQRSSQSPRSDNTLMNSSSQTLLVLPL